MKGVATGEVEGTQSLTAVSRRFVSVAHQRCGVPLPKPPLFTTLNPDTKRCLPALKPSNSAEIAMESATLGQCTQAQKGMIAG